MIFLMILVAVLCLIAGIGIVLCGREKLYPVTQEKLLFVTKEAQEKDYPFPRQQPSPPLLGKWGMLGCYVPEGLMHPEDAHRYLSSVDDRGEELFECIAEEEYYVHVKNNVGHIFRVNPRRFLWIPDPLFQVGDQIRTLVGTERVGWIARRQWHYKHERVSYFIDIPSKTIGRKHHTRRYWENELELYAEGK